MCKETLDSFARKRGETRSRTRTCTPWLIDNVTGRNARIASGVGARGIALSEMHSCRLPHVRVLRGMVGAVCRRDRGQKTKTPNRDTASRDHTCGMLIHNKKLRTRLHFLFQPKILGVRWFVGSFVCTIVAEPPCPCFKLVRQRIGR